MQRPPIEQRRTHLLEVKRLPLDDERRGQEEVRRRQEEVRRLGLI